MIRGCFYDLSSGRNCTIGFEHTEHCFDAIRQHVMCTASDELLYISKDKYTGDGQLLKCRDWVSLREWASHHSPCTENLKQSKLFGRYNVCHGGSDGLPGGIN